MVAKFQILQYSRYLKDDTLYKQYAIKKDDTMFFAWDKYAGLPENWENKFDINIFSIMESVKDSYNYYSMKWLTLGESSVMSPKTIEIIRFTYLGSSNDPIVLRVENEQGLIRIFWKEVDRRGEENPNNQITCKFKLLTQNDWTSFCKELDAVPFWNAPSLEKSEGMILDGSQWILEANINGVYKIVDRDEGDGIKTFCIELLKRTDLNIK